MSVDKREEISGLDSRAPQHVEAAKDPAYGFAKKLGVMHTEPRAWLGCLVDLFLVTVVDSIKSTKIGKPEQCKIGILFQ